MTLLHGEAAIPFGTVVRVEGSAMGENNTGIVGDAGQVYLSGLPEKGRLTAKWGQGAEQVCRATYSLAGIAAPSPSNPIRQLTVRCDTSR